MAILDGSRFVRATLVRVNDASGNRVQPDFIDIEPELPVASHAKRLVVIEGDDLAVIAARYMGDAKAWWSIARISEVLDPFEELIPGTTLVLPSTNFYHFVLTEVP